MKITIFGKKQETNEGKKFVKYTSKIKKKDGIEQFVTVKFNEGTPMPKFDELPLNVIIRKEDASLAKKYWESEDGEKSGWNFTLWVRDWVVDEGNPFVDRSLDDYE